MAREVLAYADYRTAEFTAAQREYESLAKDAAAPATIRARARGMAALIKAGGETNFGIVPPAAPATPSPSNPGPQTP
jgi:hypothetical protein